MTGLPDVRGVVVLVAENAGVGLIAVTTSVETGLPVTGSSGELSVV